MILALTGQFKQLSHEPEKFRWLNGIRIHEKKTINEKTAPAEVQHSAIIIDSSTLSRFCDAMRVIDSTRISTKFGWPFDVHNFEDHSLGLDLVG